MARQSTTDLLDVVRRAHAASPARPLRHFVERVVGEVFSTTGEIYGEGWYRRLIKEAGVERTPSTRTVNSCVQRMRERHGQDPGPTAITVKELRRQYTGLVSTVERLEDLVLRLTKSVERQEQISAALDRRQLLIQDQADGKARELEALASMVRTLIADGTRVQKSALDVNLDAARLIRTLAERHAQD